MRFLVKTLFAFGVSTFLACPAYSQTIEDLAGILRDKNIKSIAELLPYLSADDRADFTLMMKSRSLQGASVQFPRVILFGKDAKLILAFNGDPSQKDYDSLEAIQFRNQDATFDFYEIRFPELGTDGHPLNSLTRPEISPRNPAKCLACHTSDPRPNWGHYPNWQGAFLGDEDRNNLDGNFPSIEKYRETLKNDFPNHPRYRHLTKVLEGYSQSENNPTSHNSDLTQRLYVLNYLRMLRLMKTIPYFDAYKYFVVGTTACKDLTGFLPAGFPKIDARNDGFGQTDFYNIFSSRGIFIDDFYADYRSMNPTTTTPQAVAPGLDYALVKDDPDLRDLFTFDSRDLNGFNYGQAHITQCNVLAERSRINLANIPLPTVEKETRLAAQPQVLQKCVSCHMATGLQAPHIPFDNKARLKMHLQREGYPHGSFFEEVAYRTSEQALPAERMPLGGALTPEERATLLKYLQENGN